MGSSLHHGEAWGSATHTPGVARRGAGGCPAGRCLEGYRTPSFPDRHFRFTFQRLASRAGSVLMNSGEVGQVALKVRGPRPSSAPRGPLQPPRGALVCERRGGSFRWVCYVTHYSTDVRKPCLAVPATTSLGNHIPDADRDVSGHAAETPSPSSVLNYKNQSGSFPGHCLMGNTIVSHYRFH